VDYPGNTPTYFRNLALMNHVANAYGARFVLAQQPWLVRKGNTPKELATMGLQVIGVGYPEVVSYYEWLVREQKANAALGKYVFISAEPFPRDFDHLQDHVHMTPKGAQLFAEHVAEGLIKNGLIVDGVQKAAGVVSRAD